MMLPFLTYQVLSDQYDDDLIVNTTYLRAYWGLRSRDYTDFDIQYNELADQGGVSWVQTTYSNGGWYPIFKVDDDVQTRILGRNGGTATYKGVRASTIIEAVPELGEKYLLITFSLKNEDERPHTVSVSAHADVQIKHNDHATCYWYGNESHRGLTMYDPNSKITLTILVRGGYKVFDADLFWFGRWEGTRNLHYFDNTNETKILERTDSAFSVSWLNHHLYPNKTINFTVLMGVGENLMNPSTVNISTNFSENYNPESVVVVTGIVDDIDQSENVTVYYEFENKNRTFVDTFTTEPNGGIINGAFTFNVTLGNAVNRYNLKVYAIDSSNLTSNVFERDLLVNEAPKVQFTKRPENEYYEGSHVKIEGIIWDDTVASIKYQIDDGYIWETGQNFECYKLTKPFRVSFSIQEDYINFGRHKIYIWAQDEFGVKSSIISSEFYYIQLHAPEIYISEKNNGNREYHRGQKIEFKVDVRDIDKNQIVTVKYKKPEDDVTAEADSYISYNTNNQPDWFTITMEYTVVTSLEIGKEHSIIIFAVDNMNGNSRGVHYTFKVGKAPTIMPTSNPILPTPGEDYPGYADSNYSGFTVPSEIPTRICEERKDINDENFTYCYITQTYINIKTDNYVPTPTPSGIDWGDDAQGSATSKEKKKKMLIIGIAAACVAAIAIVAAAIIIHEAVKKPKDFVFNEENGEFVEIGEDGAIENKDNPIYDENGADDPFAEEFNEEDPAATEGVFPA